jgi:hypothetical protein
MSLSQSPILTGVAARQHQHDLQREAAQWRVATRAVVTTPPCPGSANRRHTAATSWLVRAARQLGIPIPAQPAPAAEALSQG